LLAHYKAVADEGGLPIVLYNVPSRTGVNLLPDTVATLSRHSRIVAIKDAAGSMDQFGDLLRKSEPGFAVLSGDDSLCLPLYALGGHGVISATATAAPRTMSQLFSAVRDSDLDRARKLHFQLVPLFQALFAETNPSPLKFALSLLGFGSNELRLPLVPVASATEELVRNALTGLGLLTSGDD
jgi:4-hydroxy-tetrahydrodipicolinate synthase